MSQKNDIYADRHLRRRSSVSLPINGAAFSHMEKNCLREACAALSERMAMIFRSSSLVPEIIEKISPQTQIGIGSM